MALPGASVDQVVQAYPVLMNSVVERAAQSLWREISS